MEKPKVFESSRSFFLFAGIMLLLLLLRLGFEYREYSAFISKPFYFTFATVENAYRKTKKNRSYQVLKLRSDEGLHFYTTTHQKKDFSGTRLRLQIFPNAHISFGDYLGTFYVKSRIKHIVPSKVSWKKMLMGHVAVQHSESRLANFYQAIFFASPLEPSLRQQVSQLGISHLIALSGFHLGILWGMVYFLLYALYRPLQQRWFPYRFALLDVGMVTMLILGTYVWFTGAPPSLIRAYVMLFGGWLMLIMGVEILSFEFLVSIILLLAVMFPSLLVSLGFWFSVAGVFFIYLLLHYTKGWDSRVITLAVIPAGIFVLMLPVVHMVFPATTPMQLLSPLLSLLFIPFYPVAMLLHLIGAGGLFDPALSKLFEMHISMTEQYVPRWIGAGYIALALWAVRSRKAFYVLLGSAGIYALYLFILR